MRTILKIIKINLLSIIALPLLLISVLSKFIAKSIEKLLLSIMLIILTGIVIIVIEFIKNPAESFVFVLEILAFLILFSIIFSIIIWIISMASSLFTSIILILQGLFEAIYEIFSTFYETLFNICVEDYEYINANNKNLKNSLLCIFFTIINLINKLVIILLSNGLKVCLILSILITVSPAIYFSNVIKRDFGLNLLEYLKMFSWYSNLQGVLMYLILVGGVALLVLSLGLELTELGEELSFSTLDCEDFISSILTKNNIINKKALPSEATENDENLDKYYSYLNDLNKHTSSIKDFYEQVLPLINDVNENVLLKNKFNNYIFNFNEIIDTLSKYDDEIPIHVLKTLAPKIKQIDLLKVDILNLIEKVNEEVNSFKENSFFAGCDTKEKLNKRYKSLCKVYHPDVESGDEETFKELKAQYDKLKQAFE